MVTLRFGACDDFGGATSGIFDWYFAGLSRGALFNRCAGGLGDRFSDDDVVYFFDVILN